MIAHSTGKIILSEGHNGREFPGSRTVVTEIEPPAVGENSSPTVVSILTQKL